MLNGCFTAPRLLAIAVTSTFCLAGCLNPRDTPVLKKIAEQHEQKMAEYTEEALKKSPDIQELDRLCTQEVPLFEGFALRSKQVGPFKATSIGYKYNPGAEYWEVRSFYVDYFLRSGWEVAEDREGSWGPHWIGKFRKRQLQNSHPERGDGYIEYALDCEKLSDAGEPLPNSAIGRPRISVDFMRETPAI